MYSWATSYSNYFSIYLVGNKKELDQEAKRLIDLDRYDRDENVETPSQKQSKSSTSTTTTTTTTTSASIQEAIASALQVIDGGEDTGEKQLGDGLPLSQPHTVSQSSSFQSPYQAQYCQPQQQYQFPQQPQPYFTPSVYQQNSTPTPNNMIYTLSQKIDKALTSLERLEERITALESSRGTSTNTIQPGMLVQNM